jgi:hypothetical protein
MLRYVFLLLIVLFLSSTNAVADSPELTPIPVLIENAKKALAEQDEKKFDSLTDQLFQRITGFDGASSSVPPEGVSDDLYVQKMCDYNRVIDPILPPELLTAMHYQMASAAYSVVSGGHENDVDIRAITECVYEDGRPTHTARSMRDGIAWVKKLEAANAEKAMGMAQDMAALAAKNPQIKELATLSKLALFDAEDKQEAERPVSDEEKQRNLEKKQKDLMDALVLKAYYGDLASQLTMARRLEKHDSDFVKPASAYYWYSLAVKNGGGDDAQAGLNRLLPQLDKVGLWLANRWLRNKTLPAN